MEREATVMSGVQLVYLEVDGADVTVDVFGGDDVLVMAEIGYHIDDAAARRRIVHMFRSWYDEGTSLTLVQDDDGGATLYDTPAGVESTLL